MFNVPEYMKKPIMMLGPGLAVACDAAANASGSPFWKSLLHTASVGILGLVAAAGVGSSGVQPRQ